MGTGRNKKVTVAKNIPGTLDKETRKPVPFGRVEGSAPRRFTFWKLGPQNWEVVLSFRLRVDDGRFLRTLSSDEMFFINIIILLICNGSVVSIH